MAIDDLELATQESSHRVQELLQDGDFAKAVQLAATCVQHCKESGSDILVALKTLARARAASGELEAAIPVIHEALEAYKDLGDRMGEADCYADLSKVFLDMDSSGDAMETAEKARKIYTDLQSSSGIGRALHYQSMALRAEGDDIAALRMAEKASQMLVEGGDLSTEVDSVIVQAQMKLVIGQSSNGPLALSVLNMAKSAVGLSKARRSGDYACEGEANLTYAQALLMTGAHTPAAMAAKEAAVLFRRCHDLKRRGRAMLVQASATARSGDWKYAMKVCEKATAILDEVSDEAGREQASVILDEIDEARRKALGLPSFAEETEARQKQLKDKQEREQQNQMAMLQQQMMMMQMMAAQQGGQPAAQWKVLAQAPKAAAAGGGATLQAAKSPSAAVVAREGSPLTVTAGMDTGIIRSKILEIATQIIGDEEEPIDADMPLMQAGLTSNTAVLLRDELNKDLPGVDLPPTLMFDYPSIAAIADFVVERAK